MMIFISISIKEDKKKRKEGRFGKIDEISL